MKNRTIALFLALGLAGCASVKSQAPDPNPVDMPKGPGLFSGQSGNILDAFRSKSSGQNGGPTNIGVNIYLWRASLESLSFMPIITADSNGGVITTDWYTPPEKSTERVRANVLILGKSLRADALKVSLFKQLKKGDAWVNTPADPATVRTLEDAILTKARALKVSSSAER